MTVKRAQIFEAINGTQITGEYIRKMSRHINIIAIYRPNLIKKEWQMCSANI